MMHALPQTPWVADPPSGNPRDRAPALLTHLRLHALACRAKPRGDVFRACRLLALDRAASCEAHLDAFLRGLGEALGKPPVLYRPGAAARHFDEAWMLQLIARLGAGDHDSAVFLLRSRVPAPYRRKLMFLATRIAADFAQT